jgi:hypothetical protein
MNSEYSDLPLDLKEIMDKFSINDIGCLRTIFDPFSTEYGDTDYDTKLRFLEMIEDKGINISLVVLLYKDYFEEFDRPDIVDCLPQALADILEYKIRKEKHDGSEKLIF